MEKTANNKDLIHCQMIVGNSNETLICKPDFSNVKSVFVNENTLEVYDESYEFLGIAERKFGSNLYYIKIK